MEQTYKSGRLKPGLLYQAEDIGVYVCEQYGLRCEDEFVDLIDDDALETGGRCLSDLFQGNQLITEKNEPLLENLCLFYKAGHPCLHDICLFLQGGRLLIDRGDR